MIPTGPSKVPGVQRARLVQPAVGQRHRVIGRRRVDQRIHVTKRLAVADEQDAHAAW